MLNHLRGAFRAPSFAAAAEFVAAVGRVSDELDHHPHIELRYPGIVAIAITTHAVGGLSDADTHVAVAVSELAATMGVAPAQGSTQALEIALDTVDADAIRPFWAAVLGYVERDGVLHDPAGAGPPMWFQDMDPPRRERGRFHLDVSVAHDEAEARVAAALTAGGRLVSDANARSWWVLADAEGNEACVSTWLDRD